MVDIIKTINPIPFQQRLVHYHTMMLYGVLGFTYFFLPISSSLKSIGVGLFLSLALCHTAYRAQVITCFSSAVGQVTIGFVIIMGLACFWGEASWLGAISIFEKYAKYLFLPFFAVALNNVRYRQWMLSATLAGVGVVSGLSILLYTHVLPFSTLQAEHLFRNHIIFGFMEAFAIYLCAYLMMQTSVWWQRLMYISMINLFIFQLYWINGGRMAYLVLLVLGSLWLWQFLPRRWVLGGLLIWIISISIILITSPMMQARLKTGFQEWKQYHHMMQDTSVGYRIQFYHYAKDLFLRHPIIGNGTGSYGALVKKENRFPNWHDDPLREPHNQYWLILSEQGLLGLMTLLCWLLSLFLVTYRLKETGPMAVAMMLAFCLSQLSDSMLIYSGPGYFFMMIMAICLGEAYENDL